MAESVSEGSQLLEIKQGQHDIVKSSTRGKLPHDRSPTFLKGDKPKDIEENDHFWCGEKFSHFAFLTCLLNMVMTENITNVTIRTDMSCSVFEYFLMNLLDVIVPYIN